MILPCLIIGQSRNMGRAIFTSESIPSNTVIEIAPVIVMEAEERILLDQTLLHDYIFEWGHHRKQCCVALGYVSIYNHSYQSNCEYEMDFRELTMQIKTVRAVNAGEELFINYNGDWNNPKKLWFDAI
jgi:uncharacterized protein